MTREVKLSLILGFAVVLAVGVLLSDHLSGARQARLDGLNPERGINPVATAPSLNDAPTLILVDEQGRPELRQPQVRPAPKQSAPKYEPVYPVRVADGSDVESQQGEATLLGRLQERFARGVQDAVTDLRSGNTPPEAAQLATIDGVRFDSADEEAVDDQGSVPEPTRTTSAPERGADGYRLYDVRDGDTLWSIAAREMGDGSRHKELAELNRDRLGKGGVLRTGASLRIPTTGRAESRTASAPRQEPRTAATDRQASSKQTKAQPVDDSASVSRKNGKTVYTVRSGDTLSGLAARFLGSSSRYEDLLMANAGTLKDEDSLTVGMELNIPRR